MMFTFAGTIGSWITEDWELVERVLDFHPIEDKEHEGEYAGAFMAKRLSELQVLEKISRSYSDSRLISLRCALPFRRGIR